MCSDLPVCCESGGWGTGDRIHPCLNAGRGQLTRIKGLFRESSAKAGLSEGISCFLPGAKAVWGTAVIRHGLGHREHTQHTY